MKNVEVEPSGNQFENENWSHVRETINMLYLAICQIDATLKDSNTSVMTLTNSFSALANHTNEVSMQVQSLQNPEELNEFKKDISDTAAELQTNISSSIQAFQFYDRVCQRLDHVTHSLDQVTTLLECDQRIQKPDEWTNLQEKIKSSYTMEAEHLMFEFIMRGGSVQQALEIYRHHFETPQNSVDEDNDEVELF